ncbi:MAG TPA: choice-of-anchor X domain-containing protein, partial [Anaerolineae bacterium]|nr:choice-of-anchor X domain-containing protein [Anaerolineae bacterium]
FERRQFAHVTDTLLPEIDKIPVNLRQCFGQWSANGCVKDEYGIVFVRPKVVADSYDNVTIKAWAIILHEIFHHIQVAHTSSDVIVPATQWYLEGQARAIEDKLCLGPNRVTAACFDHVPESDYDSAVNTYLTNYVDVPLTDSSYWTVLFWVYLMEHYGVEGADDPAEKGIDFLKEFWQQAELNPYQDGFELVEATLAALDANNPDMEAVWHDFVAMVYLKDLNSDSVPEIYQLSDVAEPGGLYQAPTYHDKVNIFPGGDYLATGESLLPWSIHYYQFLPAGDIDYMAITVTQDSNSPAYYGFFAVENNNLIAMKHEMGSGGSFSIKNDTAFNSVVLAVASQTELVNYRVAVNVLTPTLEIVEPPPIVMAGAPANPDKIQIVTRLLAPGGLPYPGIDVNKFEFWVGGQLVPDEDVISAAVLGDQQWFVIRPPIVGMEQTASLEVIYDGIAALTIAKGVMYSNNAPNYETMMVFDRSGSMANNDKLVSAQNAGRIFVDSWNTGDSLGIVTFNQIPVEAMSLSAWSASSRQTALNTIDNITASGGTAIGDALVAGWDALHTGGTVGDNYIWSLFLLSDGLETDGVESFEDVANSLIGDADDPIVHTVAVGPDADRAQMSYLADKTNGVYHYISAPSDNFTGLMVDDWNLDLVYRYRLIADNMLGWQPTFSFVGPMVDANPDQDVVIVPVEAGATHLSLALSWVAVAGGCCDVGDVILRDPTNVIVPIGQSDALHRTWGINNPASGNWTLEINRLQPGVQMMGGSLPSYVVQAAIGSDLTMFSYIQVPVTTMARYPGVALPILVSLTDVGPITTTAVQATITTPSNVTYNISLFDDGEHGDGLADDGVYGGTYYYTAEAGSYTVFITADGVSSIHGSFHREDTLSVHFDSEGDDDNDGLPNEWERARGTQVNVPDGGADPDGDGLSHWAEFQAGLNPFDPDSDDGGEIDGTDGMPHDPSDDTIRPVWLDAYPGIDQIYLQYGVRPEYDSIEVYRREGITGTWGFLTRLLTVTGRMTDTTVVVGSAYCYRMVGMTVGGGTAVASQPACATAQMDPLPPVGTVTGAATGVGQGVTLTLNAVDNQVVDHLLINGGYELPLASVTGVTDMRISNTANLEMVGWQPYTNTLSWTVSETLGIATVYAQFRDGAGNESLVVSGNIYMGCGVTTAPTVLISLDGTGGVVLDWSSQPGVDLAEYWVYQYGAPYQSNVPGAVYTLINETNYLEREVVWPLFYHVRGVQGCGLYGERSNVVGVFGYGLVAGE